MIIKVGSTTDGQKIADAFNFYFSNVAKKNKMMKSLILTVVMVLMVFSMTILIIVPFFHILQVNINAKI